MSAGSAETTRKAVTAAATAFGEVHGEQPAQIWSAPGRVNLIGEHTDYNDGYVLPFALPHRIAAAATSRNDDVLNFATLGSDGRIQRAEPLRISQLAPLGVRGWAAYPAGVAWVLAQHGCTRGANVVLAGNVPTGAGLSSSAALECAVALALRGLAGEHELGDAERVQIARWAQRAENEFVGVPTGILDQTAAMRCIAGHALFLDVRSGAAQQVPFDADAADLCVLVIDTRVKHAHSESGYGARRRGTEKAASLLGVRTLREIEGQVAGAGEGELTRILAELPAELAPLVKHVVTENQRVLKVVELLRAGRLADIGALVDASHESLRRDYRVSAPELDVAVQVARAHGALGARMIGGGFGGSAIALINKSDVDAITAALDKAFHAAGWKTPRTFVAVPSVGAGPDKTRER